MEHEIQWFGYSFPELKHLRLITLSDVHYGNPYFSQKHFDRTLDFIAANDDVRVILNGDLCESAIRTSKGEIYKQVGSPREQRDWIIKKLKPIKDKILAQDEGNHESRITRETSMDISGDIADALGIPYRPEGVLLKLSVGSGNNRHDDQPYVFWVYATHGYGGARTKSAKAVKVERIAQQIHADVYFMSHDHIVNIAPDIYLIPDNRGVMRDGVLTGKVRAHRKVLIKTNAYVKYGGYAEVGGFGPSDLYTPIAELLTPNSGYWKYYIEKPIQSVRVRL